MFQNLTGWHLLIVLGIVLLLFGATRLPALSRSLGQSIRILRSETRDDDADRGAPKDEEGGDRSAVDRS